MELHHAYHMYINFRTINQEFGYGRVMQHAKGNLNAYKNIISLKNRIMS
jgi:hypothetical protein